MIRHIHATAFLRLRRALIFAVLLCGWSGTSLARPNFIVINTDDMRADDLSVMELTSQHLVDQGATFRRGFVTDSLCCPSRASLFRGQVTHNHKVYGNAAPLGGYSAFSKNGLETSTVATWLHDEGYVTGLVGKYLNGYPLAADQYHVPTGWDEWYAFHTTGDYYNYTLVENGAHVWYGKGAENYSTDVLRDHALGFLDRHATGDAPFFLYIAPWAPHGYPTPADRHKKSLQGTQFAHPPSFNEADVSDKPTWVSGLPLQRESSMDSLYLLRLRTLLAVDEMISDLVGRLKDLDVIDDTYILFTSDNGYALGEHRLEGKGFAYDEATRVPFVIRGPGIVAGTIFEQIALNIDVAPTLGELAGIPAPDFVDGRSLAKLLTSTRAPRENSDERFVIERPTAGTSQTAVSYTIPVFSALRSHNHLYVSYENGESELYDLIDDPDQMVNIYSQAEPSLIERLDAWLDDLVNCAGASCRPDAKYVKP